VPTTTLTPTTVTVPPPKPVPVPAGFSPVSVTWISAKTGWVLGVVPGGGLVLAHTTDGGTTWAQAPALPAGLTYHDQFNSPLHSGVDRVRFGDSSDGWLFGPELWATHDGGNSWHKVSGLPPMDVNTLEAGSGMVYAVGDVLGDSSGGAFASPVASDEWKALAGDTVDPGSSLALAGASVYATSGMGGTISALTPTAVTYLGRPCTGVISGVLATIDGVAATTDTVSAECTFNQVAGSSKKEIVVSRDGGRTWHGAGTAPFGGVAIYLAVAPNGTYVISAAGGDSVLYRSVDGGATWTTVYTDTADGGAQIAELGFTDNNRGVAIVEVPNGQDHMLVTVDGGATWTTAKF